jgi:hypothetical protein
MKDTWNSELKEGTIHHAIFILIFGHMTQNVMDHTPSKKMI